MRILDVHGDNAPFFQELAQAKRRVLVVDYDSVIAPCSAPSGVPYPTVTELLDCIMATSHTRVVVITGGEAAELASPLSGPAPDVWASDAPRGPGAMFPGMLSRLGEDTAVAFLSDRDDAASKPSHWKLYRWDRQAPSASVLASARILLMVLYSALACHHGTSTM